MTSVSVAALERVLVSASVCWWNGECALVWVCMCV